MTEQDRERIMEAACDMCRMPFICKSQADLDARCESCPVFDALEEVEGGNLTIHIDHASINSLIGDQITKLVFTGKPICKPGNGVSNGTGAGEGGRPAPRAEK